MENFISALEYAKKGFLVSVNERLQSINQAMQQIEEEVKPKASKEQIEKLEK